MTSTLKLCRQRQLVPGLRDKGGQLQALFSLLPSSATCLIITFIKRRLSAERNKRAEELQGGTEHLVTQGVEVKLFPHHTCFVPTNVAGDGFITDKIYRQTTH